MRFVRRATWQSAVTFACLYSIGWTAAPQGKAPELLMQKAKHKELVDGELEAAIEVYEKVARGDHGKRELAATAWLKVGECYEKLGRQEARKAYERMVEQYRQQTKQAGLARNRLAVMDQTPDTESGSRLVLREVPAYPTLSDLNPIVISRDGRHCSFFEPESGALVLRDLVVGTDKRLALVPGGSMIGRRVNASISPDSRWVAYAHRTGSGSKLKIVGIDGSNDQVLHSSEKFVLLQGWTSDSRHLLIACLKRDGRQFTADINLVSRTDGGMRHLDTVTFQEFPPVMRLSPDDRYVAYSRATDSEASQEDVFLLPLDGSAEINLIDDDWDDDVLGWTLDGRSLLFRSNRTGTWNSAWAVGVVDGKLEGAPYLVKQDIPRGELRGPVRTPTGGEAFYVSKSDGVKWDAYLATHDQQTGQLLDAPRKISLRFAGETGGAAWSPDGKHLIYAAQLAPSGWNPLSRLLVIRELESGKETEIRLPSEFGFAGQSRKVWSADGRSVFFICGNRRDRIGIGRLDVATGKVSYAVPPSKDQVQLIGPSPDGRSLYYGFWHSERPAGTSYKYTGASIVVKDLETEVEKEMFRVGDELIGAVRLSPDGQQLVFPMAKSDATVWNWFGFQRLMSLPTSGGPLREVLRVQEPELLGWSIAWDPGGRGLVFGKVSRPDENMELWHQRADGGIERIELPLNSGYDLDELAFSPDGQQLAFSVLRPTQQLGMIEVLESRIGPRDTEVSLTLPSGYSAETFYDGIPSPDGIAVRDDGSLLVVNEADPMGVFVAKKGQSFDIAHAYSTIGSPFVGPDDIFLHPNGTVFVSDIQLEALLKIAPGGGEPTIFVNGQSIGEDRFAPAGIVTAPAGFAGPNVSPGDLIVADGGYLRPDRWAVLAINPVTGATRAIAQGSPFIESGPLQVDFGPDGRLLVYQNRDWGTTRIVTLDAAGSVKPFVTGIPDRGGLAIHPVTGQVYFGLQEKLREIWRVSPKGGSPEVFASGFRGRIQDLTFSPDGKSLFVSDKGRILQITGPFHEELQR